MEIKVVFRNQALVFSILFLGIYVSSLFFALFLKPAPIANVLGFLALLCYIATLLPSMLKIVFPTTKKSKILAWLLKYRRHMGVAAFSFGLNHGVLLIIQRHLNLLEFQTYIKYFQGFSLLLIFTLLAITSNNESVKNLKKTWKKLHRLTYLVIFILPWHILDKMSGHWTCLTPMTVLIMIGILILLAFRKSRGLSNKDQILGNKQMEFSQKEGYLSNED